MKQTGNSAQAARAEMDHSQAELYGNSLEEGAGSEKGWQALDSNRQ